MKFIVQPPMLIAGAIVSALIAAAIVVWGLTALAAPTDFKERLKFIETQAFAPVRPERTVAHFPAGAVCSAVLVRGSDSVQRSLAAKVATAGMTLDVLTVAPGNLDAGGGLAAIDVNLEATGTYAQVVSLMRDMSASRPMLFVDKLDIEPATPAVSIKLTGQTYCWISDPQ